MDVIRQVCNAVGAPGVLRCVVHRPEILASGIAVVDAQVEFDSPATAQRALVSADVILKLPSVVFVCAIVCGGGVVVQQSLEDKEIYQGCCKIRV